MFPDGVDFNSSAPGTLIFSPGSSQGDVQCTTINLLADILFEVAENFVVELFTNDPAVMIPETADLVIITIIDVPDPQGKKLSQLYSLCFIQ